MEISADQLDEMKKIYPSAKKAEEGGVTYFFLPNLKMPDGCTPEKVDALLCPSPRDGYTSRLFFAQKVSCKDKPKRNPNPKWNSNGSVRILDHTWYAFSWRINTSIRLAQMVSAHLDGLRQ